MYKGDFFPYVTNNTFWESVGWDDSATGYWTGFYSSRSALKGDVRFAEVVLRSSEILYSLTRIDLVCWNRQDSFDRLDTLRTATGECCHHDAVRWRGYEVTVS